MQSISVCNHLATLTSHISQSSPCIQSSSRIWMASQSSQQPFVADYESDDAYFPDDDRSAAPPSSSPSPSSYGDAVDSANDDQYGDEDKDGYRGGGQGEAGEEGENEEEEEGEEEEEEEEEGERQDIKIPKPLAGSSTSIGNTPLTSLAGIVGTFVEHLECAIHTILYERDIYPRQLFMSTRKYNCPVKMCRVPKVNQYVRQMVEVVGEQLLEVSILPLCFCGGRAEERQTTPQKRAEYRSFRS